jgi:pantetheine hydrolase
MLISYTWLLIFIAILVVIDVEANKNEYYIAAVAETTPYYLHQHKLTRAQAVDIMLTNLKSFDTFTDEAVKQSAQIIVFSEYGLNTPLYSTREYIRPFLEPIPEAGVNPCKTTSIPELTIITNASCIARKNNIIMVINMGEIQYCDNTTDINCPSDGAYQYNTQVAFDTDGTILAKYRKTNLYYEQQFNPGDGKPIYFDTEFGRFGFLICFDIMFLTPVTELVYKHKVTNLLFSSWWVNFPPLLNGLQVQQGYSQLYNVNFLGSNSGMSFRTSGSGLHTNGATVASFVSPLKTGANKLLVSKLPVRLPNDNNTSNYKHTNRSYFKQLPLISNVTTLEVQKSASYKYHLTAGNLTCDISFLIGDGDWEDNSLFAAFAASGGVWDALPCDMCGVFRCGGPTLKDCQLTFDKQQYILESQTVIEQLRVDATLSYDNVIPIPSLLAANGELLVDDLNQINSYRSGRTYSMSMKILDNRPTLSATVLGVYPR